MTAAHVTCLIGGLIMGAALTIADHFGVMPWLLGFILMTFSYNVLMNLGRLPSQRIDR